MVNKKENNFSPTVALPPGLTIKENIDYLGMTQKELAQRLGITQKHLSNILNGISPITYDTALKLELVIGPSAKFWMDLENNFQLNKLRLENKKKLNKDLEILKEIPYKEMSDKGWVEKESKKEKRIDILRRFFGVGELSLIKPAMAVVFRQHKTISQISDYGVLAWLRKAEIEGLKTHVEKLNKGKLKTLIPKFKELTMKSPDEFYPKMKDYCAQCGISLVLIQYIPKTYICGATIWRNNNAILALSVRGKRADVFWFTFFHEIAHLLNHSKKDLHINYEKDNKEDEADKVARNYLIPDTLYQEFIKEPDYSNEEKIIYFSKKIKIAPCIIVGRLQYDKLIEYNRYSHMIPSFEIVNGNGNAK